MCNKRGISPIIATVLLLGFTITLATTVFLWMQGQTETMSESTVEYAEGEMQCQNVRINVAPTGTGDPPTCEKLEVQNMGYLKIDKIVVRELCADKSAKSSSKPHGDDDGLDPKSSRTETLGTYKILLPQSGTFCYGGDNSCDPNVSGCEKIEVMPIINIGNRMVGCKDRTIVVECS